MRDKVLDLYLNQDKSIRQIKNILKIPVSKIRNILSQERYFTIGRSKNMALRLKDAIDYYEKHKTATVADVSRLFDIYPDNLAKNISNCGIPITDRQHTPLFNDHIFDTIDTEEKAYWLGFIYADGYIQSEQTKCFRYNFELTVKKSDLPHIQKFNTFMAHQKENIKFGRYTRDNVLFERCRWIISNKNLWEVLNSYGCTPNKSLTLSFPNEDIFKDKELIRHFIRGYFDGDGSLGIYTLGSRTIDSCSVVGTKEFIAKLSEYLPISGHIRHNKRHSDNTNQLCFSSRKARLVVDYLYDNATIYLDRKFNIYKKMRDRSIELNKK